MSDVDVDFWIANLEINNIKRVSKTNQLNLNKFNIIVGANNTGKTSFLHSIKDLLLNYCNKRTDLDYLTEQSYASFTLKINKTDFTSISQTNKKVSISNLEVFNNSIQFLSRIKIIDAELIFASINEEKEVDVLQVIEGYDCIGNCPRKVMEYLYENRKNKFDEFTSFLKENLALETKLEKLDSKVSRFYYKEYGKNEFLEIDNIGSGTKKLIVCILSTLLDPPLLLIDEPENHLHTDYIKKLVDFIYSRQNHQVIIATHSAILINYIYSKYTIKTNFLSFRIQDNAPYAIEIINLKALEIEDDSFLLSNYANLGLNLSDLFIYEKIILVEGKKDIRFYESVFKNLVHDWDQRNIGIKQTFGKRHAQTIIEQEDLTPNVIYRSKYPIPYCSILDKDFTLFHTPRLKELLNTKQIVILPRHSIENYLCDYDYLLFHYSHKTNYSKLTVINNRQVIYPELINQLLYMTIFRYIESNGSLLKLLPKSDELDEFAIDFITKFLEGKSSTITSSNFEEKISNALLKLKKFNIKKFKRKYLKLVRNHTKSQIEHITSKTDWLPIIKEVLQIIEEIKADKRQIIYHARGHNVESVIIDRILGLNKYKDFIDMYGEYLKSNKVDLKAKQEMQTVVNKVLSYLDNTV